VIDNINSAIEIAKSQGFENIWVGPVTPPPGIAIWADDDFDGYLSWIRATSNNPVLYLVEEVITDPETSESRSIVMCWHFIQGVGHLWTSEPSLRSIEREIQEMVNDTYDRDYDEDQYEQVSLEAEEYMQELAKQGRIKTLLSTPESLRGGMAIYDIGHPLVAEVVKLKKLNERDEDIYNHVILVELKDAMTERRKEIEREVLDNPEGCWQEMTTSNPDWASQIVDVREIEAREYLKEKFGYSSKRLVAKLARPPKK
jgi:hypothetical protein